MAIWTKPLSRRTLPRVRGPAFRGGFEISWVTGKGGPSEPTTSKDAGRRVCQVICVNDLGFVVGIGLGVDLGLMLVQSSVTRRRRGCGNVGIPRLLRDFPVRGGAVEESG